MPVAWVLQGAFGVGGGVLVEGDVQPLVAGPLGPDGIEHEAPLFKGVVFHAEGEVGGHVDAGVRVGVAEAEQAAQVGVVAVFCLALEIQLHLALVVRAEGPVLPGMVEDGEEAARALGVRPQVELVLALSVGVQVDVGGQARHADGGVHADAQRQLVADAVGDAGADVADSEAGEGRQRVERVVVRPLGDHPVGGVHGEVQPPVVVDRHHAVEEAGEPALLVHPLGVVGDGRGVSGLQLDEGSAEGGGGHVNRGGGGWVVPGAGGVSGARDGGAADAEDVRGTLGVELEAAGEEAEGAGDGENQQRKATNGLHGNLMRNGKPLPSGMATLPVL